MLTQLEPGDALITIDLDTFKEVNDRYGHAAGDEVLSQLAVTIISTLRSQDWAGRLGGEEFILVLSSADEAGAVQVDQRLRHRWVTSNPLTTYSAGIAVHRTNQEPRQTLAQADEALYLAKRRGRDRTETAFPAVIVRRTDG